LLADRDIQHAELLPKHIVIPGLAETGFASSVASFAHLLQVVGGFSAPLQIYHRVKQTTKEIPPSAPINQAENSAHCNGNLAFDTEF